MDFLGRIFGRKKAGGAATGSVPTERVQFIRSFHKTIKFGTGENLRAQSRKANAAYRSLSQEEIAQLVALFLEDDPADSRQTRMLVSLACLRPGSLKPFVHQLLARSVFEPGLIYSDADEATARELARLIPAASDSREKADLLLCLAWTRNDEACRLFAQWRESPPTWAGDLYLPPHEYAHSAGWELTTEDSLATDPAPDARRAQSAVPGHRDLFFRTARPLLTPEDCPTPASGVEVGLPGAGSCPWCGRQLVTLLNFDLAATNLLGLSWGGEHLRVATCHVCTCFGTVFSKADEAGNAIWHPLNVRPEYLPDEAAEWEPFPERPLVLGREPRHYLEAESWGAVPDVSFSQVGGLPTWVQDAAYPRCPECSQTMPFIGQISNDEYDRYGDGIYYAFVCPGCRVTATSYQTT